MRDFSDILDPVMPDRHARQYLESALREIGVPLRTASLAIGKNQAYLQQYIKRKNPRWLPEQQREALVKLYGVDPERLKPPPVPTLTNDTFSEAYPVPHGGGYGQNQGNVNPPDPTQLIDEPRLIELIRIWCSIPNDRRQLALDILRNLASR